MEKEEFQGRFHSTRLLVLSWTVRGMEGSDRWVQEWSSTRRGREDPPLEEVTGPLGTEVVRVSLSPLMVPKPGVMTRSTSSLVSPPSDSETAKQRGSRTTSASHRTTRTLTVVDFHTWSTVLYTRDGTGSRRDRDPLTVYSPENSVIYSPSQVGKEEGDPVPTLPLESTGVRTKKDPTSSILHPS